MGRIPEYELKRIKLEVNLADLVRSSGVELKGKGKNLVGRCPFHDDREPSLIVTPSKNLWRCMGECNVAGSVIDWVMKVKGVEFREAFDILKTGGAVDVVTEPNRPSPESPMAATTEDDELLRIVVDHYHETLLTSDVAKAYLERRRIWNTEAASKFRLGFADVHRTLKRPVWHSFAGKRSKARLEKLGVITDHGHEHFAGSIVFPIIAPSGAVTEIYGRKVNDHLRAGTAYHTYLPGPHRGIWNPECLESKDIILCEAIIDALSFWVNGFKNVTASYGTNGFTKDHLAAFIEKKIRRVFVAYDHDKAGLAGLERLVPVLNTHGIEAWWVKFPPGTDANKYIQEMTPPAPGLRACLEKAELLGQAFVVEETEGASFLAAKAATVLRSMITAEPAEAATPTQLAPEAVPEWIRPRPIDVPFEMRGEDLFIRCGEREYRVRGLAKNLTADTLRVNLRAALETRFHVDSLDLCAAKARAAFISAASAELGVDAGEIKRDVGRVLHKCESLQREAIEKHRGGFFEKAPELTESETKAAIELLKSPDLLARVLADFERCGVVGENTNKLVGYLAAVSRKLDHPLAVVIQSSSAAGKSSLMDAVLAMVPEEDKVTCSALTGQALYYLGETSLKHKVLAIAEEEGARSAVFAIKILQSEQNLKITSTSKDAATGRHVAKQYEVKGPTTIMFTTTAIDVNEELMNRCLVLTVDEDRGQTRAIHEIQRQKRTLDGLMAGVERARILKLHQNAQRLLKPIHVVNNYAPQLTFRDSCTRMRRDQPKYLELINTIALLHQHQRELKTAVVHGEVIEYIEVEPSDIATANELYHEILGRSLDELSPQTRRLLVAVSSMVAEATKDGTKSADVRFTRRQVRDYCGWSYFQVRVHMDRLVALEYVLPHRGRRGSSFVYELLYDGGGADGRPVLAGLVDAKQLVSNKRAAQKFEPLKAKFEPPLSPHCVPVEGALRSVETRSGIEDREKNAEIVKKTHEGQNPEKSPSAPSKSDKRTGEGL